MGRGEHGEHCANLLAPTGVGGRDADRDGGFTVTVRAIACGAELEPTRPQGEAALGGRPLDAGDAL